MTTQETLAALRALGLDAQTKYSGMEHWQCNLDVNNEIMTFTAQSEAEAVRRAWEWVEEHPVGADDFGAS